jgi:TrmH family RNA methyltransferase
VRALVELRQRRGREQAGRMLVEGYEELRLALDGGARPLAVYQCPELVRDPAQLSLLDTFRELRVEVLELSPRVFERIAYRQSPDGWLAEVPTPETALDRLTLGPHPLVLVCAGVEKPGNLGAMLRTADAAAVDAVIASPPVTDWGNPNIVRASRGAVFTVRVAEAGEEELPGWLRERGLSIVATSPRGEIAYTSAGLAGAVAIVVGAESEGVQRWWEEAADVRVRIPMFGKVDSLNVSTSAALVVYEALRQRGRVA